MDTKGSREGRREGVAMEGGGRHVGERGAEREASGGRESEIFVTQTLSPIFI